MARPTVKRERSDDRTARIETSGLERLLWAVFGVLFGVVALSVYLPVEPITLIFPRWSILALAAMIASIAVSAIAGVGYGWPGEN